MSRDPRRIVITLKMEVSDPDIEVIVKVDKVVIMTAMLVVEECSKAAGVSPDLVLTKSRKAPIVQARIMATAIMTEHCTFSNSEIARALGRDHTSTLYLYKVHKNQMDTDGEYRSQYNKLLKRLNLKLKRQ
jgi:chromosomal replication initiation ATPase DnaA